MGMPLMCRTFSTKGFTEEVEEPTSTLGVDQAETNNMHSGT